MKKLFFYFCSFFVGTLSFTQNVLAECTINGEVVPCEDVPMWIVVIPFVFLALFFIMMILGTVLWVWMIIDAAKNEKENDLVVWILILVFLQIIGAVVYYFARKRPRDKEGEKVIVNNENTKEVEEVNN